MAQRERGGAAKRRARRGRGHGEKRDWVGDRALEATGSGRVRKKRLGVGHSAKSDWERATSLKATGSGPQR